MGWFSGLIKRLTTGHAQGMDNVAMVAIQRCVIRFPEVFKVEPWDSPSSDSLERLHEDAEYLLADRSLSSAFEAIVSTGDRLNAAIALVERAKLNTRVRDWGKAGKSTEEAMVFCTECISLDPDNKEITQLCSDALIWRGTYLQIGCKDIPQAMQTYQMARALCQRAGDQEGLFLIRSLEEHISS